MSPPEERIARLAAIVRAWADGQLDAPCVVAADGGALADLEQALAGVQEALCRSNNESSSLANANVRLMLWNEALQKINHADSILYHGGDIEIFYQRVVADAMEMTRARYGALAVFDRDGGLAEFVTRGMEEHDIKAIGGQPQGKGLLAAAFTEQTPLRVVDIGADPRSCGFPPGHPPMTSLMAVPMRIGGKLKGVIYLADKEMGELFEAPGERFPEAFTADDEIMLGLFSDYLVRALERIELMQMLKDSNHLLEMRGQEQEALIRKLHEAKNQLLQAEKMASIGQLAAGVAHEINNPIGFINSNVGSLERYLNNVFAVLDAYEQAAAGSGGCTGVAALKESMDFAFMRQDIFELMGETKDGVARVKKIVQDLKDFSHVDDAEWQWANLHKGLDSTLNVVWNEIKYKAEVVKEYGDLPQVECMPGQMNQVFMNLLVNAAHAIAERGKITLSTGRAQEEVWVEIGDSGCGIAP